VNYYLAEQLYRVIPVFYEVFGDALEKHYGIAADLPALLRFATVDSVWFTLSGVLLGSAISLILVQIFLREE